MLIRHSILYTVAKIVPGVLGIATTAILTHLFNPTQYGIYGLISVIMTLTANVAFDWLAVAFLRFYEKRKQDPRTVATFFHIFAALLILSGAFGFPLIFLGSRQTISLEICLLGIALAWAYSAFEMVSRFDIANFRPGSYFTMSAVRGVAMLAGAVGLGWATNDPIWASVGAGLGMLIGAMCGSAGISSIGPRHLDPDLARQVIKFGIPLAISMSLSALTTGATRLLIEGLDSREALGLYTAAYILVQNVLTVLAGGISSIGFPLAVRAREHGDIGLERRQLAMNFALLLAVLAPTALGMILTAQGIAATMVGEHFKSAVAELTPWLAVAGFFASLRWFYFDYAFQLGNRPNAQAWVSAITAVVAICLSFALIPRMGPLGAAISVTVAMVVSCCLAAIVGRQVHHIPFPVASTAKILLGCVIMTIPVLSIPGYGTVSLVLKILVGAAAYSCAVFMLDVLDVRTYLRGHFLKYRQ
jgi:O-antigen/teichoic acid export membrane protein